MSLNIYTRQHQNQLPCIRYTFSNMIYFIYSNFPETLSTTTSNLTQYDSCIMRVISCTFKHGFVNYLNCKEKIT